MRRDFCLSKQLITGEEQDIESNLAAVVIYLGVTATTATQTTATTTGETGDDEKSLRDHRAPTRAISVPKRLKDG